MTLITDLLSRASNGTPPVPTTLASQKASGASSLTLNLATGWDTSTPVHFLLYEIDANSNMVSGTETLWKGVLSGTTVSSLTLRGGTDTTYPADSPVELAFTSAQLDDLITALQVSHNPDGSMVSSLPLTTPVLTSPTYSGTISGWVLANESWTYASATTITVPSDATTKYDAGDFLQFTQSATVKYFVVTGVASTLLTVAGLGGATVASASIATNSYSKARNPHGNGTAGLPYNPCKFSVYRNGGWTDGNNADALVTFDAETFDTGSNYSTSTGKFTATIPGLYSFYALVTRNIGGSALYFTRLYKNGAVVKNGPGSGADNPLTENVATATGGLLSLAATDYVQIYSYGNGGSGVTGAANTFFEGHLVSAA